MRRTLAGPQSSTGNYKPSLDPGTKVASSAAGSPSDFYSKQNLDLNSDISKGAPLKHVATTDKSTPKIEPVQVKKVDRKPFIQEVEASHDLQHVDNVSDRSNPTIEGDVHVKKVDRHGFLQSVEEAAREKGTTD